VIPKNDSYEEYERQGENRTIQNTLLKYGLSHAVILTVRTFFPEQRGPHKLDGRVTILTSAPFITATTF
jgi:hypothetical protein